MPKDLDNIYFIELSMSLVRQNFNAECENGLNRQINNELASSYFYLAVAFHFDRDDIGMKNFYKYFHKLSDKKKENVNKFLKFMSERGGHVQFKDIPTPANNFQEPIDIMKDILQHEKEVNEGLLSLRSVAERHKDNCLCDFMDEHFLNPKVEQLKEVSDHIANLTRVGDGLGVYQYDHESL